MENYTITISVEGDYFGFKIQDDSDNVVNWDELPRDEQLRILQAYRSGYILHNRYLKDE